VYGPLCIYAEEPDPTPEPPPARGALQGSQTSLADDETRQRPVSLVMPLEIDPNEDADSAYRPLAAVVPRRKRPVYSQRCESEVEAATHVVHSSSYASGGGGAAVVVTSSTAARVQGRGL